MLAIATLLALAISGGLFAGTILHTINRKSQFDQVLDIYQRFWT